MSTRKVLADSEVELEVGRAVTQVVLLIDHAMDTHLTVAAGLRRVHVREWQLSPEKEVARAPIILNRE
ncbi:MAG: hypothetical protein IPK82_15390 [Polyangiaceae bacterium]|nr:hypothetical protein [Polyangiaceae bacterium]